MNVEELVICNLEDKKNQHFSKYCIKNCQHSRFHYENYCMDEVFCNLHESQEVIKVKCRKINNGEINIMLKIYSNCVII